MTESAPIDRMQVIADYRTTRKFLRKSGQMGIIFGCFFLLIGALHFDERLQDYLYLGLGTIELLIGVRNRYYPSATGIILDGIMLIVLGIWNLSWQAVAVAQGDQHSWLSAVFGAMVIVVGVRRILRYPRVKAAFDDPPTDEQIAWFDDVIKEIHAATPATSEDMVEFRSGLLWKGKRSGGMVIFVDKLDQENLIVDPRDIDWTDRGKTLFGGRLNVSLRIGERTFGIAGISPEMLLRLESWKSDAGESSENGDDEPRQAQ